MWHVKSTWLMSSSSKPHSWHLPSTLIRLFKINCATGSTSFNGFHRKILIFGSVITFQTYSFNGLTEGKTNASGCWAFVFTSQANQYADLTEKLLLLLNFQEWKSLMLITGWHLEISSTSPGTKISWRAWMFHLLVTWSTRDDAIKVDILYPRHSQPFLRIIHTSIYPHSSGPTISTFML